MPLQIRVAPGMIRGMSFFHYSVKAAYLIAAWFCLLLGALALLLPVIPTSPFLILGLWLLSKGSERFRRWLSATPWLEPVRKLWRRLRAPHAPWTTGQWILLIVALVGAYGLLTVLVVWTLKRVPWSILLSFL